MPALYHRGGGGIPPVAAADTEIRIAEPSAGTVTVTAERSGAGAGIVHGGTVLRYSLSCPRTAAEGAIA